MKQRVSVLVRRTALVRIALVAALVAANVPRLAAQYSESPNLPRAFREMSLGMNLDALKEALKNDSLFRFRGDRDVSFVPVREESLVETTGTSYIRRAFFQLRDGAVFVMAFSLDTAKIDHYSVFSSFVEKYGEPETLSPREAVWQSNDVRLSIERPLTIKYIDMTVFSDLLNESTTKEADALRARREFIDGF